LPGESGYAGAMLGTLYQFGDATVTGATLVAGGAAALFFVLLVIAVLAWRKAARRVETLEDAREDGIAAGLAELRNHQSEITGQVRGLADRLDGFGHRVGQSMSETARGTHESLAKLGERLAVIDKAQRTITDLSSQVVELQHILANKQTRGAFGQGRMEAIVRDGLPTSGYEFQATLSNGNRPDCLILFPNGGPSLVIDAKFPLEGWSAIRAAETPEAKKAAEGQFRRDTAKHIQDIAERYLITGETQDTAFMFVPSESIFFDIHEHFEDIVQRAHRARVVIVSPTLLMLSIQVVMSLLRDVRMREQAHIIQQEVIKLMDDVGRLDERVRKLGLHFGQANKDIEDILVSSRKIAGRGEKIKAVDVADGEEPAQAKAAEQPATPRRGPPPELPFSTFEEV
jgi:DNA recombination protein RmuC